MNMMLSEVYDALISAGAEEAKARLAAEGLATAQDDARRQYSELREDNQKLRTEMTALRGEIRADIAALSGELMLLKWMMGVLIAFAVAAFARLLFI